MFSREGDARTDRQNRLLAGSLALIAGFANSAGFVVLGIFTSHVTGTVGRVASDVAGGRLAAAVAALSLVLAFFFGAFVVSVMLESGWFGHVSRAYASALTVEGMLLSVFTGVSAVVATTASPRAADAQAALLCAAMGMQNALVTRLSGAVVRTTHLTGVVTDLGIESARWFRHWRHVMSKRLGFPLIVGPNVPLPPMTEKLRLLGTIGFAFLVGAVLGAVVATRFGWPSMGVAVLAIATCALYAFHKGRLHDENIARVSRR